MANTDVYELVTNRILEALDRGTVPWRQPWSSRAPLNLSSSKHYRGVNVLLLELARMSAGYDSPVWATFKQWKSAGGSVRKGEKGTVITFWKTFTPKGEDPSDPDARRIPLLRYYYVFNRAQVDGNVRMPKRTLELAALEAPAPFEAIAHAEDILEHMPNRPRMIAASDAWYAPREDTVGLPARDSFLTPAHFYATAFHELAHSTAHESRVGRPIAAVHADPVQYAREELIAEIAAAMVLGAAGVDTSETFENTAAYVDTWRRALSADPKLIIAASAGAQRAADYIRGLYELEAEDVSSSSGEAAPIAA